MPCRSLCVELRLSAAQRFVFLFPFSAAYVHRASSNTCRRTWHTSIMDASLVRTHQLPSPYPLPPLSCVPGGVGGRLSLGRARGPPTKRNDIHKLHAHASAAAHGRVLFVLREARFLAVPDSLSLQPCLDCVAPKSLFSKVSGGVGERGGRQWRVLFSRYCLRCDAYSLPGAALGPHQRRGWRRFRQQHELCTAIPDRCRHERFAAGFRLFNRL